MKIYKVTDKIPVKIGELTFTVSPLSRAQKADIHADLISGKIFDATCLAIKYAVKSVSGIDDYNLELEDGILTDESVDNLMNITEVNSELSMLCVKLLHGVPKTLVDPDTGEELRNVKIDQKEQSKGKK